MHVASRWYWKAFKETRGISFNMAPTFGIGGFPGGKIEVCGKLGTLTISVRILTSFEERLRPDLIPIIDLKFRNILCYLLS